MLLRTGGLLVLAALLGMGGGLLLARLAGSPSSVVVDFVGAPTPDGGMRVYVSGAVMRPGVYPVQSGARVIDAVTAAGGPAADANTNAVPFAARITDGETVYIPRVGEAAATVIANQGTAAASLAATAAAQRIDLNHADAKLLQSLPGIGKTRATNIINSRQNVGLFQQPEDLVQRKLVTAAIFNKIKDQITVAP